jgi:propanol-preferring alcohol dehydrogenase
MRAVQLSGPGQLVLAEVPVPEIGDDEVLVEVAAAGLCHSDLHILDQDESWPFFGNTIGHEAAGRVVRTGAGVQGLAIGDAVLVSVIWFCGRCRSCLEGRTNTCTVNGSRTQFPQTPGIGPDGGMAEYMKVRAIHVDPIGDLDPVAAAPLADAGTTSMHAVNSALDRLRPDSTVVVIGIGGLGHTGLQILRSVTGARIVAVDTSEEKLAFAREHGAQETVLSDGDAAGKILALTHGDGVDAVLDFVGAAPTVRLATEVVASGGALRLVGLGGGSFPFNADISGEPLPWGVNVQRSFGGTHQDQLEVIALAQQGKIGVDVTTYALEDFQQAVDDLRAGKILGRAVLVP